MTPPVRPAPRQVLFIKLSAMGDQIFGCAAVEEALQHDPTLQIDWVVDERFAAVARLHPGVRQVIALPLKRWQKAGPLKAIRGVLAFARALRRVRYDLIIDGQGMWKSVLVGRLARARERVGYSAEYCGEAPAARFYDRHLPVPGVHGAKRLRATFAQALGYAMSGPTRYGITSQSDDPGPVPSPYAVLLHGASKDDKLWPERDWTALAHHLMSQGLSVILPWGTSAERARAERIVRAVASNASGDARNKGVTAMVAPQLTLMQCTHLIGRADLVVGLDTGLIHMATALARPAVALFVATRADFFDPTDPALGRALGGHASDPPGGPDVTAVIAACDSVRLAHAGLARASSA